jgi:Arc/MetJ family transcription regulator
MRTNIIIDDELLAEAMAATGAKTKTDAIHEALRRTVRARKQLDSFRALKGLGWDGDLDDMRMSKHTAE